MARYLVQLLILRGIRDLLVLKLLLDFRCLEILNKKLISLVLNKIIAMKHF